MHILYVKRETSLSKLLSVVKMRNNQLIVRKKQRVNKIFYVKTEPSFSKYSLVIKMNNRKIIAKKCLNTRNKRENIILYVKVRTRI